MHCERNLKWCKEQAQTRVERLANHTSDQRLVCQKYKEFSKSYAKQANNARKINGQRLEQAFHQGRYMDDSQAHE